MASAASVSAIPETAARTRAGVPEPPTAAEQQAQHDAYKQSSRDLDTRVELSGHSAKDLEMNFERFMASLYMTAMMQLGLMHEQGGQPGVDMIGARQTIDTLGMIAEKTKGNLTPKEQGFLQNCLYELRMAYVEVTNALAHPPQASGADYRTIPGRTANARDSDGIGQRHVDGGADHWLRLRRLPFARSARSPHASLGDDQLPRSA